MKRAATFYIPTLALVGIGIFFVLHLGAGLPSPQGTAALMQGSVLPPQSVGASASASLMMGFRQNASEPLSRLFVQLLIIIGISRLTGRVFVRLGQPAVVGEMAAGILLGPSLFGWLAPEAFQFVFPAASFDILKLLSQIGVCLFMFAVGMELDTGHMRKKADVALLVGHAGIVIPYFLGVVLAWFLYSDLAQPGAGFTAFALFMGISMSITAFPVLARILQERGLTRTFLGRTAITCAAVNDVTAWSLLAFVVAIARATSMAATALNLVLVLAFIALMIWGLRPALPRWLGVAEMEGGEPSKGALATVFCVMVASAWATEIIGIHALFGAFLAGAVMPEAGGFRHKLSVRIENFSSVLLLPLFFAFTGLRAQIGLLEGVQDWLLCLGIIAVATLGKLGGSAIAARWSGISWSESLQLGALMNTRGLMELIALNMGYDLGILSPRIFTMLVIMALTTTVLTGPLLTLFGRRQVALDESPSPASA